MRCSPKRVRRVLWICIGVGMVILLGLMLFAPPGEFVALPDGVTDVREFRSSNGPDSNYGMTARGSLSEAEFWSYAETMGFSPTDRTDTLRGKMGWQDYPDAAWAPPSSPAILLHREVDVDSVRLLAWDGERLWYSRQDW